MADRCEKECPWMRGAGTNLMLSNPVFTMFQGFTSPNAGNEYALQIHRGDMERAEHCSGPVEEVVLVTKGMPWDRRTVQKRRVRCGLSQPSPCAIPSELVEV
jgi:hypothetical protein